ncbi:TM0106 family RecB-like putative nuclease [Kovacikia minuta CCNUW1]|uniref:TM0106 family RecB-like putative nuclease n=1 Tax=Kovacikia minuta TaxID=2931930 RepID=UPI001CCD1354|nr:TM0106 family RecB-like putative nuclease [Kovacikia minuta]UBF23865.1 TM0106 family RecB-like putative nuclease [Kovacikia minuta CCNUW1]
MLIDADLLLNFQRCNRRAFLDKYGNFEQRDPPNDYLLKILQDSQANRQLVMADQPFHQPSYSARDWQRGAEATLALMQQGTERIYQGALFLEEWSGVTLVSNPDLLVKQPGQSIFGDWLYVPTEIKLGKRPKLEYQITAAYHVFVLAQVQGAWPETVWLLLRERGLFAVDLWDVLPRMQEILDDCVQTLTQTQEPEVFISRNRCTLCHWFSHCYAIAKTDQHLSLLPGVTPTRYLQLQALNLTTVKSLADVNPAQLEPLPGFGREAAYKLVRQARSTLQNRALPCEEGLAPPRSTLSASGRSSLPAQNFHPILVAAELPTATVELYFDIEAEPALNLVYLHGVLVVDRQAKTETFHAFLAEHPEDEATVWQAFLDLVWKYPTAPIFHFCPFEVQTVERLAKLYGTPSNRIKPLLTRFVDLHERVTRLVTLPVESYALKPIARWLGFDWRDATANGAQSIYWYAQWQTTGDRTYLDSILAYNEDDCRATHHIKDWLVNFLQSVYQAELA